ncbi:MAG: EamA family transporter [Spirochaetaceae bacterium]|jgi:multidrug transporter EmrE-like cation transporter|nr:EamA family transporter [Spirochaetaceae bacterium]
MRNNIPLVLGSVSLNAVAQVLMRQGMLQVGKVSFHLHGLLKILPVMLSNAYLWLAFCCYILSILLWMTVLSRMEVSFAYAFSSLGFVLTTVMGALLLKEQISLIRITGICIICVGVIIVAKG